MQYKKVLICGVDTAALPILTEKQKEELLTILKNASHIEEYLKQTSIEQLRQKHNLLD